MALFNRHYWEPPTVLPVPDTCVSSVPGNHFIPYTENTSSTEHNLEIVLLQSARWKQKSRYFHEKRAKQKLWDGTNWTKCAVSFCSPCHWLIIIEHLPCVARTCCCRTLYSIQHLVIFHLWSIWDEWLILLDIMWNGTTVVVGSNSWFSLYFLGSGLDLGTSGMVRVGELIRRCTRPICSLSGPKTNWEWQRRPNRIEVISKKQPKKQPKKQECKWWS